MLDRSIGSLPSLETPSPGRAEVVEVPLLLTEGQVLALEHEAHSRGVTAAELLRSVLRRFIETLPSGRSVLREC